MSDDINLCRWPVPREQPHLAPGVVHVWCLALDLPESTIDSLRAILSSDEQERTARYLFDKHRRRFIACRGQVRQILAAYLGADPAEIRFRYGARGKPDLSDPWRKSQIQFNISDSHEMALCALARHRELGVDLEYLERPSDFDSLAAHFFAPREVGALRSLPEERRVEAFFNCWTRKEAVLKAVGVGLSMPLNRLEVTLVPQDPARVLIFEGDTSAAQSWWLESFEPATSYIGALASHGSPLEVVPWRFEPAG
jgi:4'-phosphopantetheinyl transferase